MDQVVNKQSLEIANFLERRLTFIPTARRELLGWDASLTPLPTKEHFANALVQDAEFRALQLGTWLGTTDGEVIEEAVGMVISPIYAPEYALAVDGLKLAARLQQQQGSQVAGVFALIVIGAGLAAAGLVSISRSAA